jgi:NAD(P)-dependent dehydrogenase (short-subunit alcohol dehydrogenase family)
MPAAPDLKGRVCMITGATSGIGKAAALGIARRGAEMVLVCRDRGRAESVQAEIFELTGSRPEVMLADLSAQREVRSLAERFLTTGRPLHVLVNNAGLLLTRRTETVDGLETTFAVNHLAPFLLTNLLLDRLRASAPARIVTVASEAHRFAGRIRFDNLNAERSFRGMRIYGQSKLANILFTRELARRLAASGVTANCLHPGTVATRFGTNNGGFYRFGMRLIARFIRTPEKGAETVIYLAASPGVEGVTGKYFFDCRERTPGRGARSDEDARRLWELSASMTGLSSLSFAFEGREGTG